MRLFPGSDRVWPKPEYEGQELDYNCCTQPTWVTIAGQEKSMCMPGEYVRASNEYEKHTLKSLKHITPPSLDRLPARQ